MPDRYRDRPPFPPDDDYRDYRQPQQHADNDPLAELARLIGQTDPFSNFGREQPAPARRADPREHNGYGNDDYPQEDYQRGFDPQGYDQQSFDQRGYDQQGYDEPAPSPPSWMRNSQPAPAPAVNGRSYDYDQHDQRNGYGPQPRFDQPRFDQPRFDEPQDPQARYEDALYGQRPVERRPEPRYDRDPRYDDNAYEPDDGYAEEPASRPRRGGTMTVIVVLALAVVGTAAAYAYRSFMGSPRSGEPPIIRADAGPNKIVPPSQSSDGKQIYDRVNEKGERVVSREEQPVDVNGQQNSGQPRVVFPPLSQNASPPTTSAVSTDTRPTGAGVGNGAIGEEPRRVRTLTIRPDQPDASSVPTSAPSPAPAASVPPARTIPMAGTRNAPAAASAPMALTPQTDDTAPAAAPAPRARVASVNPATSAPSASGSYVQVSSQKSEADALASYKVLQGKYSGILGARSPVVRRADLGDKGVFYRALVGPFGTTDEATQFCVNLQSAGGKCIVQRN